MLFVAAVVLFATAATKGLAGRAFLKVFTAWIKERMQVNLSSKYHYTDICLFVLYIQQNLPYKYFRVLGYVAGATAKNPFTPGEGVGGNKFSCKK